MIVKKELCCENFKSYTLRTSARSVSFGNLSSLLIFSSCDEYESWTNDPPEINTFTVPKEVRYGESVELKVGVSDPENDELTYTWEVSAGTLTGEDGAEGSVDSS